MEQLPHWLMVTVFAAGMTAYAEEVNPDALIPGIPAAGPSTPAPAAAPGATH